MDHHTASNHELAVRKLAVEVAGFHAAHTPFRINHGSTNSTRRRDPNTPQLHISHLNHILAIDTDSRIATVEPNVPLDLLVSESLQLGFMPLVVMEFPGITIGGGFSGASGESTGWKEGLFDCSVEEIEMILGNGDIVRATKNGGNSDLFDGARCTLGTMGVITLLKVRLTETKDAVQLTYHHTSSINETINRLSSMCEERNASFDFIEAIQYSMQHGVITTGRHVSYTSPETRGVPRQRFDRAIDPWFYMHARETFESYTDIIPTQSYLFRHDRGAFWSGEVFFNYYGLPNNRFFRWLLNPIMTARAIYKAMLAVDSADGAIVQDLLLPVDTSEAFVRYVDEELKIWPLWICPTLKKEGAEEVVGWPFYKSNDEISAVPKKKGELTLNFGVWGPTDPAPAAVRKTNRDLEQKLRELRGMKVPYAANFYTEDEFWSLYDRPKYDDLRKRWHAEALPSMYEKVRRVQTQDISREEGTREPQGQTWKEAVLTTWPLGGLYQTYHVIFR
ncbi:hypothetical protein HBH98_025820 [Parastagonospora nodorum]|nr:hypothetical protein HBH53_078370 [Parastagonospora nodorum]KAH3987141.1 hypothetical protein HBH51_011420 [Parastagonospora nodorum]KAH3987436.1 hypothetical protein HBH52_035990 [Parastagonospora nodorum]KAH4001097.1 hypothetical protein HBI10_095670 [Parastagonospora nodorum]KAH4033398.1 hypothetical protein HBI13_010090 [Parastagonospora nodorum]